MSTLEQRIEEFKKECKVFNLDYEYKSCDGPMSRFSTS